MRTQVESGRLELRRPSSVVTLQCYTHFSHRQSSLVSTGGRQSTRIRRESRYDGCSQCSIRGRAARNESSEWIIMVYGMCWCCWPVLVMLNKAPTDGSIRYGMSSTSIMTPFVITSSGPIPTLYLVSIIIDMMHLLAVVYQDQPTRS